MAWYVYILEMNTGKYYVWSTKNIENRIIEHQNWESKSTRHKLPVKLLYYKEYLTIIEAIHMETKLKKCKSRKMIQEFMKG
jgi:putative endonuclease